MPRRNDRARAAIPNSWSVQRSASAPTWIARSMRWSASCRPASCSTARSRIFASTAATWRSRVGDSVRRNPVPILLAVAGLGWLVRLVGRASAMPIDVTRWMTRSTCRRISLRRSAQLPRSRFHDRVAAARARTRRAQYRAVSALEERPLLFGGLAVAIGALLGAVIPSTQYEDKVVGQVRDRAVERAKQMGERQYQNLRSRFETHQDVEVSGQAH